MAIPERINAKGLNDYLEIMARAILQSGMRWSVVEGKWPDIRHKLFNFETEKVAALKKAEIAKLAPSIGILSASLKLQALVHNANVMLQLDQEYGGFRNYLQAFPTYQELSDDIKKRFKYMGEFNVYYLLFRVRLPVPHFEEWVKTIPGEHPRMKEMVELAREQDQRKQAG